MDKKKSHVLFICTGNMARSPMAEGILKQEIKNRSISNLHVSSAGLMAISDAHAAENAVIVSRENGVDISAHRSRFLTRIIIDSADIVFVMEEAHKQDIAEICHNIPFAMRRPCHT